MNQKKTTFDIHVSPVCSLPSVNNSMCSSTVSRSDLILMEAEAYHHNPLVMNISKVQQQERRDVECYKR